MRLFFSNSDCTSGQLVIASHDSQYKILHFHHGGLDKLAQLFEQWSAVKARSVKDVSPFCSAMLKREYVTIKTFAPFTLLQYKHAIF